MGTLAGHLLPGSFFIAFSVWASLNLFYQYFTRNWLRNAASQPATTGREPYQNSIAFNPKKFPLASMAGLVAIVLGILGETWTGFDSNGVFVNIIPNGHHIVMYSFFALYAIAGILLQQHISI